MNSGKIRIEEKFIFWYYNNEVLSEIIIDDIVLIGEYTINSFNDDWFLVFVAKHKKRRIISLYAENIKELLIFLSNKFHPDLIHSSLTYSTNWKSIVRYPLSLQGKELFKLDNDEIELSSEIEKYLS